MPSEPLPFSQRIRARESQAMDVEDLSALDPLGSGTFDDESHDFSQQLEMEERDRELAEPADPGLPSQRGDFSAPPTPEPLAEGIPPPSQQPLSQQHVSPMPVTANPAGENPVADSLDRDALSQLFGEFDDDDALQPAPKRRRAIPGGETSDAAFAELFQNLRDSAAVSIRTKPAHVADTDSQNILKRTARIMDMLQKTHPEWPNDFQRLVCAALSVYRLRLIDMFVREHILLLWIIEGNTYLRVHGGTAYFYDEGGAFQAGRASFRTFI